MRKEVIDDAFITIGHRGLAGEVMENTLESIDRAIAMGARMVEVDVHKIKSGHIVVFHDENLKRLTGIDKEIADCDWDYLKEIRLDKIYKIPLISHVIKHVQYRCRLNIELKSAGTAMSVSKILRTMYHYEMLDYRGILISSFNHKELQIMRNEIPSIPIGVLPIGNLYHTLAFAQKVKATSIHPSYRSLKERHVRKMQEAGYKVYPYTVNKKKDKERMREYGVDGLITDNI